MNKNIKYIVEDLLNDIYNDSDNNDIYQHFNIFSLPFDTSLKQYLMNVLNIDKIPGFKFIKHTDDEYDKFIRVTQWRDKYKRDLQKLVYNNKWEEYNKFQLEKFYYNLNDKQTEEYIRNYILKYLEIEGKDPYYSIYVSPDKSLILYIGRYTDILTFTGKYFENTETSKDKIYEIKNRDKLIRKFGKYVRGCIGSKVWNYFYSKKIDIDTDGYPYMYLIYERSNWCTVTVKHLRDRLKVFRNLQELDPSLRIDKYSSYELGYEHNGNILLYFIVIPYNGKFKLQLKLTPYSKKEFDKMK